MATQPAPAPAAGIVLPAFEDGLGRRYRPTARGDQAPPEILCFRPELTDVPAFEFSLRERVARFAEFRHASYARIRKVDRLSDERGTVVLMSDSVGGVRLCELLTAADQGRAVLTLDAALCLVRQLIPAMTLMQRQVGVAHGAMAPERLLVTPQGKLIVVEYAAGAALEQLRYSRERYWKELRVALPAPVSSKFDESVDLTQMGIVTLSLILGRNLRDDEFPAMTGDLINSASARGVDGRRESLPSGLREWLRRALDVDVRQSFKSLAEAQNAFDKLASVEARDHADVNELQAFLENYRNPIPASKPPVAKAPVIAAALPPPRNADPREETEEEVRVEAPRPVASRRMNLPDALKQRAWIAAGVVGVLVVAGGLYVAQAGSIPDAPPAPPTPMAVTARTSIPQLVELPVAAVTTLQQPAQQTASAAVPAADPPAEVEPGWVSVASPFDMDLYEQGKLLGSTGIDRIMLAAGRHDIEIVNEALGYREPRTLTVQPNRVTSISVTLPKGTISLNALPWANVTIDGESVGETPIGNLSLAIGPHEVVFTNPQLGEQRRVITVTQRSPVRFSIDLTKK